ncbi:MAG TPA: ComEC/Rec2 family competence protein [Bacteroidia bacterium]
MLIPVVAGILTFKYTELGIQLSLYSAVSVGLLALLFTTGAFKNKPTLKRSIIGLLYSLTCYSLAMVLTYLHNENKLCGHFTTKAGKAYVLQIEEIVKSDSFQITYLAKVLAIVDHNDSLKKSFGKTLIKLKKREFDTSIKIAQILITNSAPDTLKHPIHPWKFDYRKYLESKQIYKIFNIKKHQIIEFKTGNKTFKMMAIQLRDHLIENIKKLLPREKDAGFAEALLLGYKSDLNEDLNEDFMKTGTLHVLAVSGLHVGLIYMILNFLFKSFGASRGSAYIKLIPILIGLWTYVFITGIGASILRAGIMFTMIAISDTFNRKSETYNTIFASAFIILIFDSNALFDVGFQLSYLAVIGIVYMNSLFELLPKSRYGLISKIQELSLVTLAAQLFTFPLSLYYFHQFPIYFLPANLLIIPLTTGIMLGIIAGLCIQKITFLSVIIEFLIHYSMKLNEYLVGFFAGLPHASISGINWSIYMTLLVYPLLIYFTESIKSRQSKYFIYGLTLSLILISACIYHNIELNQQKFTFELTNRRMNGYVFISGRRLIVFTDSCHSISEKEQLEIEGHFGIKKTFMRKVKTIDRRH